MSNERFTVLDHLRRIRAAPPAREVSDSELIQRFALQRDESAFELLLWRHSGMVLGVCRAILQDHHLAEDAFQATFLALARKAGSIGQREAVAGWLYRVAHNAALKARRCNDRDTARPLIHEPFASPRPVEDDLPALLHEELGRLPEKYRLPLVLCYLEGQSHADAAQLLGWPKGTVAGRIARAKEVLRRRLSRRGVALSAALLGTALNPSASSAVPPTLILATVRASLAFVSGNTAAVSAPVLRLAEGVFHAMFLSKLKSFGLVFGVLGCVVLGGLSTLAVAQKTIDPVEQSAVAAEPENAPTKAQAAKAAAPEAVGMLKDRSITNLKKIALASHKYLDKHGTLPNNILGLDKKPLLSWRVLLLPYLGQSELYKKFKLDESWESKHNRELLSQIPEVYRTGTEARNSFGTYYQGFAHEDAGFPPGQSLRVSDIRDGMSYTILAIEAGNIVPWTKPADLPYAPGKPLPKLGGPFADVIHTLMFDGSAFAMKRDFDEKLLRLAITRNDDQLIDVLKLRAYPLPPPKPQRKRTAAEALLEGITKAQEASRAEARAAREQAEVSRRAAEVQKQENEKLKEALRDVIAQLEKLLPAEKGDKKPAADEVKVLKAELERIRAELRILRDKVKRLEKVREK